MSTPALSPTDYARLVRTMAWLLGLAWAWQTGGILLGALEPGNGLAFALTLGPVMFSPLIAGIVYQRANGRRLRNLPWRPGKLRYTVLALAIPTTMALVMVALWQALGWGSSTILQFADGGIVLPKGPWVLGRGTAATSIAIVNVLATMLVFGALNAVATIGEEFGWRGVFQAPFVKRHGLVGGVVLLGLVWGFWHLPVNLAGYNHPRFPVIGALVLFPALLVAHSMVLAWLTIAARSLWPAVFFHAGINSMYVGITASLWREGHAADFHAIELALFGLLGGFALSRLKKQDQVAAAGNDPGRIRNAAATVDGIAASG